MYNAYKSNLVYFKVFNSLKKGKIIKASFFRRIIFIMFLFQYKSQFKIWIGLYPFIIYHYLFIGHNYMQPLNKSKKITKPYRGKMLL